MSRRAAPIALLLLLLLAAGLRFGGLGAQELRGDESFGVLFAKLTPEAIVRETISAVEPHPPLDYFILRGWMALAGDSEFAVRFPSAVAGVLAVAMVYVLGKMALGRAAGMAAAGFAAASPYLVWHAQEARMYAISAALTLAATLALWRAVRHGGWVPWAAFALLTAAHCYLHYYAFFIALAHGLWALLMLWREPRRLAALAAAAGSVVVLYSPWLVLALPVILAYHGNGDSPALPALLLRCLGAFSLGQTIRPAAAAPFLIAFGLLFGLGLLAAARAGRSGTLLLGLWLGVPLAGVWIASLRRPVFDERYVIAASLPFYLFLGAGAAWLARKKVYARALLAVLSIACLAGGALSLRNYYALPEYSKTAGWRQVMATINAHALAGDIIVQNYPDPSLAYYNRRGPLPVEVVPASAGASAAEIGRALDDLTARYDRLWFLPYPSAAWDAAGAAGGWLEAHTDRTDNLAPGGMRLQAFLPLRVSWAQRIPVDALLGDAIRLRGYRLAGSPGPGATLDLTLYWEAQAAPAQDYTVFVHVVGAGDAMLTQDDHPPQNGAAPTSGWRPGRQVIDHYRLVLPADAPTGTARVLVGMYDPVSGDRLPARGRVDALNRIHLADVAISRAP